jgi:5'-3' exonuclease
MLARVIVHLVDGTAELFRYFHALPAARNRDGEEVAAVRGVMYAIRGLVRDGATHIGIATDHVGGSFRNALWDGYRTGERVDPALRAQIALLDEGLAAWGLTVWPMTEVESPDAIASAARRAAAEPQVERVVIWSLDRRLAQCVAGTRVVQGDRAKKTTRDEAGVVARFGVPPASMPDYLALVGEGPGGIPGLPGWGAKSAALVLARFGHLEAIPDDPQAWGAAVRGAASLAVTLARDRRAALTYRTLMTLRTDLALFASVDELAWRGPTPALSTLRRRLAIED